MNSPIILLVHLFVHPGREAEFCQFEAKAAQIMARYHGRIERIIHPTSSTLEVPLPHEIHLVSFPSMAQFEAYRQDPNLVNLALLRQSAIARTDIIFGEEGEPYRHSTADQ